MPNEEDSPSGLMNEGDYADVLNLANELRCTLLSPSDIQYFIAAALLKQNALLQEIADSVAQTAENTTP